MAEGNKPTSKANVKTNAKAKVGLTDEEKHLLYDESNGLNAKDKKHALALMTKKEQDQYKLALKKQAALKTTAGVMKKTSHEQQHLSDAMSDGAKHEELGSDGALCSGSSANNVHKPILAAEDAKSDVLSEYNGRSNSANLQELSSMEDSDADFSSTYLMGSPVAQEQAADAQLAKAIKEAKDLREQCRASQDKVAHLQFMLNFVCHALATQAQATSTYPP